MIDTEGTQEIIDLIKRLNRSLNKTIITITHDLSFAQQSDYLIVLKEGQVILEGNPKTVFEQEDLLRSSHLELPFELKLYNELKKDEKVNSKIVEALWAYNSKM